METPTNILIAILWMLGGLGLFLYGIEMMSTAMRRAAGARLRAAFDAASRSRFRGLAAGTIVTALIQSSSATTVMVVGFINAGLLTFRQSLGVILGANIGTTITPFITGIDLDEVALPILGVGFIIYFISMRRVLTQIGLSIMGFGMLFFGLVLMKNAVSGYHDVIHGWLEAASGSGALGLLTAFLVTMAATAIIQSSSAAVVMIQVLAIKGVLTDIEMAIPLILGAHVGTCITAMLASLQSDVSARRSALAHFLFNLIGAAITVMLLPLYNRFIPLTSEALKFQVANAHLAIKLINAIIFLPFLGLYGKFLTRLLPGSDKLSAGPEFLDFNAIKKPEKALQLAHKEINRMYKAATTLLDDAVHAFISNSERDQEGVVKREECMDDLYRSVCEYLVAVSRLELDGSLALRPALLLHIASDVERIGDHAENIVELNRMTSGSQTPFSKVALHEIADLNHRIKEMEGNVADMFADNGESGVEQVLTDKQGINECVDRCISNHSERMTEGTCNAMGGILFVELVINLRRVSNHLRNIAVSLSGEMPEQSSKVNRIRQEIVES